jgi:hypothetical protein
LDQIDYGTAHMEKHSRNKIVKRFLHETLKADGVFLLRLISSNTGDVVTNELIEALWTRYKERHVVAQRPISCATLLEEHHQPSTIHSSNDLLTTVHEEGSEPV